MPLRRGRAPFGTRGDARGGACRRRVPEQRREHEAASTQPAAPKTWAGFSTLECGRGFEAHHTRRKRRPVSHLVFRTGHRRVPIETSPESEAARVDSVDTIAWDDLPVSRSRPIQP